MDSYGNPTTEKLTVSDYNPIKFNFPLNTKYLFTIISEQAENFCPLPQIPTTTI